MRGWAEQVAVQVAANVAAKVQHQNFDNDYKEQRKSGGSIPYFMKPTGILFSYSASLRFSR